jgi:selenide,water dikinase
VRLAEPAAVLERVREHALELRRDAGELRLGLAEARRVAQRLHRRVDIGVAELALRHLADNTAVTTPDTKPRTVKLTSLSHGAGCACKIPPGVLHPLLADLPRSDDPALLVGHESADDAAVYKLSDELAIVTTVDFFTPIVDDPYDFGRIAAANALSDVYAMGGRPLTALNLVAYSLEQLGQAPLREILRGGADVAQEAGVAIVGGHSIDDREPKYGLAVTGAIDPRKLLRNSTARVGDALYMTKAVGGGVASTAAKRGLASKALVQTAIDVMTALNRDASILARAADTSAMTDVTGFGLLGHLHEMALGSGVAAEIDASAVPAIRGALKLLRSDEPPIAGGSRRNREWVEPWVDWDDGVHEDRRWLLCDAMTSGGLLIAARPGTGAPGAPIGRIVAGEAGRIAVRA